MSSSDSLQRFLDLLITAACMREPARVVSVGTMGVTGAPLTEVYLTGCGPGGSISERLLPVSQVPFLLGRCEPTQILRFLSRMTAKEV